MEDKQKVNKKSKKRVWIVLLFLLLVSIYMFVSLRGQYLSVLELGENYTDIFKQNLTYNFAVLIINFILVFLMLYISNKFIHKGLKVFFDEDEKQMPKLPNKSISLMLSTLISIFVSPNITDKVMLAFNTAWFGINDPIFNLDIGYFFFQKPFIEILLYYFLALLAFTTVYTFTYYIIVFNVYLNGINLQTLKKNTFVKQICTYILLIAITIAGITFLNTQNFLNQKFLNVNIGSDNTIYGAGLTDVTIKLWGYRIFSVVIVFAVAMAIKAFRSEKKKKAVAYLISVPAYLVSLFIVMAIFQFVFVDSNELDRERKYISYNIENTKRAYNINIEEKEISNSGAITTEQVTNNKNLISNIPVISKNVTLDSLQETQTSTGYYTYRNTNLASYKIANADSLVYVSPREIQSDDRRTYNSQTYEYTHGNGVIITDATEADSNGNVVYIQKDYNGNDESVKISEPRIYFGLHTNSNIIINSNYKKEFDYPISSVSNAENIYDGDAGLKLNWLDRLILGITKGDLKLAFNTDITKDTKIITDRNVISRAKALMPNLIYDDNPYMVIRKDGTLIWVLDAYTVSDSYPYSQESIIDIYGTKTKINYIRNSVKVIIDAYNGTMKFYITDRSDPIAMAYHNIYPTLFMNLEESIPEDIQEHIIYPKYLYDIQANMLTRYHDIQTEVLYRNDDNWSIAKTGSKSTAVQKIGTKMNSYYTMSKPEGSNIPELSLIVPYTLENKQSINAYLVGKYNNGNNLTLYKFNHDDNVVGIMQLENQIERDEKIAKELETINVTGSRLIKEMIVIPFDSTLLYIQPIYQVLLNETQIPILKKVIVASGNKVAIGNNLNESINNLLSQQAVELDFQNTDNENGLIEAIIKANNNLKESSSNKDWQLMGSDIEKLQKLINQLEKMKEEQANNDTQNIVTNNVIYENFVIVNNIH